MNIYGRTNWGYWHSKPTTDDFGVSIISKHPEFDNKKFKIYNVEGINTIGVWDKEPFIIELTNRSNEDISATISLDGVDVLSGKPAELEPNQQKWIVRAGSTLHLKAFHETNAGGSRFVFSSADKSVALHTSGDVSHKGIIAVAVFTEGDRSYSYSYYDYLLRSEYRNSGPIIPCAAGSFSSGAAAVYSGQTLSMNDSGEAYYQGGSSETNTSGKVKRMREINETNDVVKGGTIPGDLKKEVGIAAGEYVEQKTRTVDGLRKPELHSITRVRYVWFDDLVAMIKKEGEHRDMYQTGFPGAKIKTFADLSGVPKVESSAAKDNCVKEGIARFND